MRSSRILTSILPDIFPHELFYMIERDHVEIVIQIRMDRTGNDHELLVIFILAVLYHIRISIFGEITGMSFLSVDYEDCTSYLIRVL